MTAPSKIKKDVFQSNLRRWQSNAADAYFLKASGQGERPLLAACPGAGKTVFGTFVAISLFESQEVELAIVVVPTTHVKRQWSRELREHGFDVNDDVDNQTIASHRQWGVTSTGGYEIFVITYGQLASQPELWRGYADRYNTLVVADEVHHADDRAAYGKACELLAGGLKIRSSLALSGTPFNSKGGSLAMCDSTRSVDEEGNETMQTIPFFEYSYADALNDDPPVCRMCEFVSYAGKASQVFRSLLDDSEWTRFVDLANENKTDKLAPFLDIEHEFLRQLIDEGLIDLVTAFKPNDSRAAALIVAKDKTHAREIEQYIVTHGDERIRSLRTALIVSDTSGAHARIKQLDGDNTDVVISVKMLSEGVDVKRLRVGIYATNVLTRMFFVQFVGRFVRWNRLLDEEQFARIHLPGHIELATWAREIERMVSEAIVRMSEEVEVGTGEYSEREQRNILVGGEAEVSEQAHIARGEHHGPRRVELLSRFKDEHKGDQQIVSMPNYVGHKLIDWLQKKEQMSFQGAGFGVAEADVTEPQDPRKALRKQNTKLVGRLARLIRIRGKAGQRDDNSIYGQINYGANKAVGIRAVDDLTPVEVLEKRARWLVGQIKDVLSDQEEGAA